MVGGTADRAEAAFAAAFPIPERRQQQPAAEVAEVGEDNMDVDPVPQPGQRLQEMRNNFNSRTVRMSSKAPDTFVKSQNHNERFILHLFEHDQYHPYLNDNLRRQLQVINTNPNYDGVDTQFPLYRRRGGKKTLPERREDHRISLLRKCISYALNKPGMTPRQQTVNLAALEQHVDVFVDYLTTQRRADDSLMKPKSYLGLRSSLTYLFKRYRYTPSRAFESELKECMEGIKRYSTKANQHGEGNIWDGDRPLTWELYEQFNKWFYAEGDAEGIFAVAFAKLTCNLACRGKNTGQVCLKQIKWAGDCMAIPFAHSKDAQGGDNSIKKLPRHCYANPINFLSDGW